MRGELDNYRPVYLLRLQHRIRGTRLCNGWILGTNYFHINWGWYGYYNGYFYLSALNPGTDNFTQFAASCDRHPTQRAIYQSYRRFLRGTTFPPIGWSRSATSWNRSTSNSITGTASAFTTDQQTGLDWLRQS